jgi:hypothetical protein
LSIATRRHATETVGDEQIIDFNLQDHITGAKKTIREHSRDGT